MPSVGFEPTSRGLQSRANPTQLQRQKLVGRPRFELGTFRLPKVGALKRKPDATHIDVGTADFAGAKICQLPVAYQRLLLVS